MTMRLWLLAGMTCLSINVRADEAEPVDEPPPAITVPLVIDGDSFRRGVRPEPRGQRGNLGGGGRGIKRHAVRRHKVRASK